MEQAEAIDVNCHERYAAPMYSTRNQMTFDRMQHEMFSSQGKLPYGINDLVSKIELDAGPPERVRCLYRGCHQFVRPPADKYLGQTCHLHGIRSHKSGTYSYADPSRNAIVDPELFGARIVGHPAKFDTEKLRLENSEDTLSWNVFRTFQKAGCLSRLVAELFRIADEVEPDLYLWGIRIDDALEKWDLLTKAQKHFESNLPVERPLTEPDIALHVPGKYLLLIEAKFGSKNPYYVEGPRKNAKSLTLQELRDIYCDDSLELLNFAEAKTRKRIHYQLWRNTIFSEWIARQDSETTKAFHINLVREEFDVQSALEFRELINADFKDRFLQVTWEEIYRWAACHGNRYDTLCTYFEQKTHSLRKAFRTV
jgi:hypothetical protein